MNINSTVVHPSKHVFAAFKHNFLLLIFPCCQEKKSNQSKISHTSLYGKPIAIWFIFIKFVQIISMITFHSQFMNWDDTMNEKQVFVAS